MVAAATATTVGALMPRTASWYGAAALFGVAAAIRRLSPTGAAAVLLLTLAATASLLSARAWAGLAPAPARPVEGWLTLRTDPDRRGAGVTAVGEFQGERFAVSAYGGVGRRLERLLAGDRVLVGGRITPFAGGDRARWVSRHVRSRVQLQFVGDTATPAPLARAANQMRHLLTRATNRWPAGDRALFLGLVIGDDRDQPDALVQDFRDAGLSHLTAVSGQNVAFVLVAATPLLRRMRPGGRFAATLLLIGWFATLTRFEPSVIRASGMAALAAATFWRGWRAAPLRLLALTVMGFTLIDPLLVHSVGWWLSIGATAGLTIGATRLAEWIPGPRWIAEPLGVTLGAQLGVVPVSMVVFGRLSLVGPLANLLAVPVAGFVMIWGIPAGLVGGAVPSVAAVAGLPSRVATRWVASVARLAARVEPAWSPIVVLAIHAVVLAVIVAAGRSDRRRPDAAVGPTGAGPGGRGR